MSSRTDYTEEDWRQITDLPRLAVYAAMAAEEGGAVSSMRELWAGMMEMVEAARKIDATNPLIEEIVQSFSDRESRTESGLPGWDPQGGPEIGATMVEQALLTASRVREALSKEATPEEAAAYAAWVLGIARAGVGAVRTGPLGMIGEQMTEPEARFMRDLSAALAAA